MPAGNVQPEVSEHIHTDGKSDIFHSYYILNSIKQIRSLHLFRKVGGGRWSILFEWAKVLWVKFRCHLFLFHAAGELKWS